MDRKLILLQSVGIFVMDLSAKNAEARFMGSISDGRVPAKLSGWLSATQDSTYVLFIDLPSEEIQSEVIPVLGRGDRRQYCRMLDRKHRQTHCLSRVNTVAKDSVKIVQKVGVADDDCASLLQTLVARGCLIQSIHSPLTLIGTLSHFLKKSGNSRIYVLPIGGESYRIIACVGKQLLLNRGVAVKEQDRLTEIIGDSLRESLVYLRRQSESDWQQVSVCTFSVDLAGCLQDSYSDGTVRVESVAIDQGIRIPRVHSPYTILSQLAHVAIKVPSLGYRLDVKQDTFLRRRITHAVAGVAASLMLGATAIAAVNERLVSEYESISQEHREIETVMDNATVFLGNESDPPVEAVRQALATAKLVDIRSKVSPLPFLYSLSENKFAHRAIQIHTVDWLRQDRLDIQSLQSLDNQGADDLSVDVIYRAIVVGSVDGDLDDAMTSFDSFLASLRRLNKNATIRVTEAPFGLSEKSRTTHRDISVGEFRVELTSSMGGWNGE